MEDIADWRFSPHSKFAFGALQLATKYQDFQRRDGSLVNCAQVEDQVIRGRELERAIMDHFHTTHNSTTDIPQQRVFPTLSVSPRRIRTMAANVSQGKAIAFDGLSDGLFKFPN